MIIDEEALRDYEEYQTVINYIKFCYKKGKKNCSLNWAISSVNAAILKDKGMELTINPLSYADWTYIDFSKVEE